MGQSTIVIFIIVCIAFFLLGGIGFGAYKFLNPDEENTTTSSTTGGGGGGGGTTGGSSAPNPSTTSSSFGSYIIGAFCDSGLICPGINAGGHKLTFNPTNGMISVSDASGPYIVIGSNRTNGPYTFNMRANGTLVVSDKDNKNVFDTAESWTPTGTAPFKLSIDSTNKTLVIKDVNNNIVWDYRYDFLTPSSNPFLLVENSWLAYRDSTDSKRWAFQENDALSAINFYKSSYTGSLTATQYTTVLNYENLLNTLITQRHATLSQQQCPSGGGYTDKNYCNTTYGPNSSGIMKNDAGCKADPKCKRVKDVIMGTDLCLSCSDPMLTAEVYKIL